MAITNLDPKSAHAAMAAAQGHVFVDVRTPMEYAQGHPAGAVNVPWALPDPSSGMLAPNPQFVAEMAKVATPDRAVYLSCQSGGRSMNACRDLEQVGYKSLVNIDGGFGGRRDPMGRPIAGWRDSGLPVV